MSIGHADERAGGDPSATRDPGASGSDGGRQRDEAFVTLMRSGDDTAFGLLFDAWADPVYDRINNRGFTTADATQIEANAFGTVERRLAGNGAEGPFRVMAMRASRQEMTSAEGQRVDITLPVGPYAEDRLTRGTEVKTLAADPAVAALLWEAVDVLGDQVREVLDLHYRHGFEVAEVAAVLQQPPAAVEDILRKVPAGYSAVVRAKISWRQGQPHHNELAAAVAGQSRFDAAMVRRVAEHLRTCEDCRNASQVPVPPIEVFAAIPIAIAPAGFKESVVAALESDGVSMKGSVSAPRPVVAEPVAEPSPDAVDPLGDRGNAPPLAAIPIIGVAGAGAGLMAAGALAGGDTAAPVDADRLADTSARGSSPLEPAGPDSGSSAFAGSGLSGGSGGSSRPHEHLASENRSPLDTPFVPRTDGDESPAAAGLAAFVGADAAAATSATSAAGSPSPLDAVDLRGPAASEPPAGSATKRRVLIAVGAVIVLGLIAFFATQGGSSKKSARLATAPTGEQSTTTVSDPSDPSAPSTTSVVTTVTTPGGAPAPTTAVTPQSPTTAKPGQAPPVTTVQNVTTTTNPLFPGLKRTFVITGANPINTPLGTWSMSDPNAPNLRWAASADTPISVLVSGPGFSSVQAAGSSASLCPGTTAGDICTAAPGNYAYTLTVSDTHGHSIPETIVLTVVHN